MAVKLSVNLTQRAVCCLGYLGKIANQQFVLDLKIEGPSLMGQSSFEISEDIAYGLMQLASNESMFLNSIACFVRRESDALFRESFEELLQKITHYELDSNTSNPVLVEINLISSELALETLYHDIDATFFESHQDLKTLILEKY